LTVKPAFNNTPKINKKTESKIKADEHHKKSKRKVTEWMKEPGETLLQTHAKNV